MRISNLLQVVNFNDFYTPLELNSPLPRYTLPLINAMPLSQTNVIEDDGTSSSGISKLDSDQLTHSSDDDASSDSTPNVTTLKSAYKRR